MGVFQNNLMGAAAAAASAGGGDFYSHQIANSCRFDGAASKLVRDPSSDGNLQVLTFSTWVKRSGLGSLQKLYICGEGVSYGYYSDIGFDANDKLFARLVSGSTMFLSTQVFRDPSAWYHIVMSIDTTQSVADNRCKVYINGERITAWDTDPASTITLNYNTSYTSSLNGSEQVIGNNIGASGYFNGYMAETYLVDGTAKAIGDTGETKNGVWIPKDPSGFTYGTNGFLLNYASSSDLGNDVSGNNNDFTATAIAASDQMLDSPTFNSDSNGGNFCTWNPLQPQGAAQGPPADLSEGNLLATNDSSDYGQSLGTMGAKTGKWYVEYYINDAGYPSWLLGWTYSSRSEEYTGSNSAGVAYLCTFGYFTGNWLYLSPFGSQDVNAVNPTYASFTSAGTAPTTGDIIMSAMDFDAGKAWYGMNGEWGDVGAGTGNPATAANPSLTWTAATYAAYAKSPMQLNYQGGIALNAGQDPTFFGNITAGGNADDTGYGNFKYDVPAGFLSLCAGNLPTAAEVDPAETSSNYPQKLFAPKLYTGTGSSNALTGLGFQPDLTWIKERGGANDNKLTDSTRGVTKAIESNENTAETTDTNGLTAFGTDGFTVGSDAVYNNNTDTYVSWNWRANGGTTSAGSGDLTSTHQVDPSGCFSIVKYIGNQVSNQTWSHGLSVKPDLILLKGYSQTTSWVTYHSILGATKFMYLNTDAAAVTGSHIWYNTEPTTSVVTVDNNNSTNYNSGATYIAYCFANCEGYMNFGSYVGNGNAAGPFVYTGFKPKLLFVKLSASVGGWWVEDTARDAFNPASKYIGWDKTVAEATGIPVDFLSNGFKIRSASGDFNSSGATIIYGAWAENPFAYATAR